MGGTVTLQFQVPTSNHPLRMRATTLRAEPPNRVATQFHGGKTREHEAIRDFVIGRCQE
jgi:hypothetical protein